MDHPSAPIATETDQDFDAVLARLPDLLKQEGFGVITEIDLQKTFGEKLGVTFRRYRILGACNPGFAHRAVAEHPDAGVMLPCNVVVYEREGGGTRVVAVDPMERLASSEHDLADVGAEVRARLEKVVRAI
jgi:uncharacterized protein (DUF302 family)